MVGSNLTCTFSFKKSFRMRAFKSHILNVVSKEEENVPHKIEKRVTFCAQP